MSTKRVVQMCVQTLCLLILLPTIASAAAPPGTPDDWSNGFVYANGIRIHYYHAKPAPGKPVIVMAHGITDNGLCWTTLAWELQDDYDIYMVDTRGHGLSDPFTAEDDRDTLIKDLAGFVKAMGFEKPIMMGHSMGAATVMRLGAEYPELASAIIMLDPIMGRRGPGRRGDSGNRPERTRGENAQESREEPGDRPERARNENTPERRAESSDRPERARDEGAQERPNRIATSMMGSPEQLVSQNNQSYEDLVEHCRRSNPKWGIVDCQYWALSKKQYHGAYSGEQFGVMSGAMQIGDSLEKIPVPAIILKADTSPEGREANLEAASVMQMGKLVHIDDAAHNLHHDQLERTTEVIEEFLATLH